jgi:hypothetical protein
MNFAEWLVEKLASGELVQEFDESLMGTGPQNTLEEEDLDEISNFNVELAQKIQVLAQEYIS